MKKLFPILLAFTLVLTACGNKNTTNTKNVGANDGTQTEVQVELKDGTYTGVSEKDEHGGYMETTITVEGGKITDATLRNLDADGTEKGEDYGKVDGEIKDQDMYDKAQQSLTGAAEYPKQLVEKGSVDALEAVSGATSSLERYKDAANKALEQAK